MNLSEATIEEALKQHLIAHKPPQVRTIETYGGQFDDLDLLAETVRVLPGIWVVYGGSDRAKPIGTGKDRWLVPLKFVTFVAARSVRNEAAARIGQTVGGQSITVGAYQLLKDVRRALLQQDFGLALEPLQPGAVDVVFNGRLRTEAIAIYSQVWHTTTVIGPEEVSNPAILEAVGLNYYLKPDDAQTEAVDAADLVTLST